MANKSVDDKRKTTAKIVRTPKKASSRSSKPSPEAELKDQYYLIRDDINKLRDDLAKGYDMARTWIDKKGALKSFLKTR
jgi:hypothetical protein